jgi:outer membrane protein insertion porin family
LGYGGGYGTNSDLPFFKNFYAGGVSSVRGYDTGTIGPKYLDPLSGQLIALGGNQRVVGNAEILFPMPGLENDKSVRLSAFFDAGAVFGPGNTDSAGVPDGLYSKFSFQDIRFSTGVAVNWVSPVGPLKFSLGMPLNPQANDKKQVFQFTMGQVF